MSVRGIRPIRRDAPLSPAELAVVPSDKPSIEPLLTLEEEIALMAAPRCGCRVHEFCDECGTRADFLAHKDRW